MDFTSSEETEFQLTQNKRLDIVSDIYVNSIVAVYSSLLIHSGKPFPKYECQFCKEEGHLQTCELCMKRYILINLDPKDLFPLKKIGRYIDDLSQLEKIINKLLPDLETFSFRNPNPYQQVINLILEKKAKYPDDLHNEKESREKWISEKKKETEEAIEKVQVFELEEDLKGLNLNLDPKELYKRIRNVEEESILDAKLDDEMRKIKEFYEISSKKNKEEEEFEEFLEDSFEEEFSEEEEV